MNKIILSAKNKKELDELIKKNITLSKNETYTIKEIKKPFSFLFIKIKGKYEITITNKNSVKKSEKIEKVEKIEKNYNSNNENNELIDLVKNKIINLLDSLQLDIKIASVERKNHLIFINLEGKDVKYIIGEKGIALNSLEYLLNSIKQLKNCKIILDANGYRKKREASLLNLANKKARKVMETKTFCKLSPMSSKERRIIHEELSKYPYLETESHGIEPKRYLVIKFVGNKNE